jgi:excisionase family DNA binding protein
METDDEQLEAFAQIIVDKAKREFMEEMRKTSDDKLLSPSEVAQQYRISKPTLWRWAKAGYLVPIALGGKRRYRKVDVDNFISKKGAVEA